jgi:hypothetical protein
MPYFPRVYKTLMDKFIMLSKIGLRQINASHSIVATRPITMFQNRPRKINSFHSTVVTIPFTMLPKYA